MPAALRKTDRLSGPTLLQRPQSEAVGRQGRRTAAAVARASPLPRWPWRALAIPRA